MFDEVQLGWLGGDDYEVVAAARAETPDSDRPDATDVEPRRDLLGELLAGRWSDDDPPTVPR